MSYHRPSAAAINYGLPASENIDYGMFSGARQASGEGRGYHQRSTETGYTYSKSNNGPGKSSKSSKSRPNHERDQGEDDEGAEYPNYIPSSSSRSKSRASSSTDYACWFFKLDPVKYVDCMHVHGRSSDLKYAHLKNHFKDGAIPPEFDKNMGWDEVWSTLFPGTRQPNNKYYVINDMILSVLESASVNGDDVSRFLDTLVNRENREVVINRIHSLSRDQGNSPGAGPSSSSRRNRQNLQLPSFERTPRTVDAFFTPPSSSSSSSNTTPAISSRSSHRYTPSFDTYHHSDLGMIEGSLDTGSYPPYTDAVGTLSPEDRGIAIYDETYTSLIWFGRELPWPGTIDFEANYLEHACNRAGHDEPIRICSFDEFQNQYQWHEAGQVAGSCPFTLTVHRRA
ncbi:hypothetical protein TWF730_007540 [Orbilia blumenaviensis]|uniref:Uncharacterized protein n=1 Tax=Orbilia blumenaviensis TaxID=1796055 RepID=A0AAV9VB02_9PEZI